jgi:tRNA (guanine37-N1)-methyltransferase
MQFTICSLFVREMFNYLNISILNRARNRGIWNYDFVDLREQCQIRQEYSLDDRPYGGQEGMVLRPDALDQIDMTQYTHRIYLSPRGRVWKQHHAHILANTQNAHIFLLCGRYEGIDQRIIDYYEFDEVSIGDFVLCGGELPAMVLMESVVRLLPGAISNASAANESFSQGLLEHALYTRPAVWNGQAVPAVLVNGNHKEIEWWKFCNSLQTTLEKRPDLIDDTIGSSILIMLFAYFRNQIKKSNCYYKYNNVCINNTSINN